MVISIVIDYTCVISNKMFNFSLDELVVDNKNGLVFNDSQDLYEQWMVSI